MPSVHTIRLRHPWRYERLSDRIRYRRRFKRPWGMDRHVEVDLVFEGPASTGHVYLNGVHLGEIAAQRGVIRFWINEILQLNNEILVELEQPQVDADQPPRDQPLSDEGLREKMLGEVRLEITVAC